jgi:hypothetical protein
MDVKVNLKSPSQYSILFQRLLKEASTFKSRCRINLKEDYFQTGEIPEGVFTRVVSFSDVHGDWELLLTQFIITGGVIQMNYETGEFKWVGGKTAVVINGDLVDRHRQGAKETFEGFGTGEFEGEEYMMFLLINAVDLEAQKHGGKVFKIMGNHELMQMFGQFANTSSLGIRAFGSPELRQHAFFKGGIMNEQLRACKIYAILRIGTLIFVHAGLDLDIIVKVRTHLQSNELPFPANVTSFISFCNSLLRRMLVTPVDKWSQFDPFYTWLFGSDRGLLWTRELSSPTKLPCSTDLVAIFKAMGYPADYANKMMLLVGHTPTISRCQYEWQTKVQCPNALYTLQKVVYEDKERQVFGGAFKKETKMHGISFDCLNEEGFPRLCLMDTSQSRAFDLQQFLNPDYLEIRKPSLIDCQPTEEGLKIFVVRSKVSLSR